jgi:hypothetical protein
VVVRDFNVVGIAVLPAEAYPVLLVDPNAMLTLAVTCQPFQPVPRWDAQLRESTDPVKLRQLSASHWPQLLGTRPARPATIDTVEQVIGGAICDRMMARVPSR